MTTTDPRNLNPQPLSTTAVKTQLDLFGSIKRPPHNRTATSREAAESLTGCVGGLRLAVLRHIAACGDHGATADEIQDALSMRPQTCSARCNELREAGLIRRDGRKRKTSSGRQAFVCIATESGKGATQ